MIQRYEVWEDNYCKREDGKWCKADDAILQDAALDVLVNGFVEAAEKRSTCKSCIIYENKLCDNLDNDKCAEKIKAYAIEEARRRILK